MFERFTERARETVVLAQDDARQRGLAVIGAEMLLLAMARQEGTLARRALDAVGISYEAIDQKLMQLVAYGQPIAYAPGDPGSLVPFTADAKKVLELSLREALSLGHNYIGTEHILLGLMRMVGSKVILPPTEPTSMPPTTIVLRMLLSQLTADPDDDVTVRIIAKIEEILGAQIDRDRRARRVERVEKLTCQLCGHRWIDHHPADGKCDHISESGVTGACQCGHSLFWMQRRIAGIATEALRELRPRT